MVSGNFASKVETAVQVVLPVMLALPQYFESVCCGCDPEVTPLQRAVMMLPPLCIPAIQLFVPSVVVFSRANPQVVFTGTPDMCHDTC